MDLFTWEGMQKSWNKIFFTPDFSALKWSERSRAKLLEPHHLLQTPCFPNWKHPEFGYGYWGLGITQLFYGRQHLLCSATCYGLLAPIGNATLLQNNLRSEWLSLIAGAQFPAVQTSRQQLSFQAQLLWSGFTIQPNCLKISTANSWYTALHWKWSGFPTWSIPNSFTEV